MINQSDTIAALAEALSKAQGEMEGAKKTANNPHFRNQYADLASVWDACRDALSSNGLAVIQSPGPMADGRMEMTTTLAHKSGEWMRGTLTIPLGKADAQAYGSATTYARRYALAAFVGIAPEDDDGNAATAAAPKAERNVTPLRSGPGQRKTPAQAKRDGDSEKFLAEVATLDLEGVRKWFEDFDVLTAEVPVQWLDSFRDKLELRREEIMAGARAANGEAELDAAFRGAVG